MGGRHCWCRNKIRNTDIVLLQFSLTSLFSADSEKKMESPRPTGRKYKSRCGRKMLTVQGGASASCLEAVREGETETRQGTQERREVLDLKHM